MIVLSRNEAAKAVCDETKFSGRAPVAIGLIDHLRAVLLFRMPCADYEPIPYSSSGCREYATFDRKDAEP